MYLDIEVLRSIRECKEDMWIEIKKNTFQAANSLYYASKLLCRLNEDRVNGYNIRYASGKEEII